MILESEKNSDININQLREEDQINAHKETTQNNKEMQVLQNRIQQLEKDNDKLLRTAASYSNMYNELQKQTKLDIERAINREQQGFFETIIGIRDTVLLAIDSVKGLLAKEADNNAAHYEKNLIEGLHGLDRSIVNTMQTKHGLEEVKCNLNDDFDYNLYEAVGQQLCTDKKLHNKIAKVVKVGYKTKDKMIKAPKVEVYKYSEEASNHQEDTINKNTAASV